MKGFLTKGFVLSMGCIMMLGLTACNKSAGLNDYVEVEYEGYDGYGEAKVVFDIDKFEEDYGKMKFKGEDADAYSSFYDSAAECIAKEFIEVEVKEDEGLSNGDSITVVWDCDEEAIKELTGYTVKYESITVEVEGLEEAPEFDAFEGVKVTFKGVAPYGEAVLETEALSGEAKDLTFELDKEDGLSNGDVVTVKIANAPDKDAEEYYIDQCGAIPKEMEKQCTVEGLNEYVADLTQITEEAMIQMDENAQRIMADHAAADWGEDEEFTAMTLLGNYFLKSKEEALLIENALFFVYKITVVNSEYPDGLNYYYYTYYPNVVVEPDGTIPVNEDAAVVPYGGLSSSYESVYGEAFRTDSYWYIGFEDLQTIYDTYVLGNAAYYDYVSTVTEE